MTTPSAPDTDTADLPLWTPGGDLPKPSDKSDSVQRFGPDAARVNDFHQNDDCDSGPTAHHHTLGRGRNQAMPGDTKLSGGTNSMDVLLKQGPAGIATNVFPAGLIVPTAFTAKMWILRCNLSHTPTGSALTVLVKRSGSTILTLTLPAGASASQNTTAVALNEFDILYFDFTSVGSTTPVWDVALFVRA